MKKKILSFSLLATSLLAFGVVGSTACNSRAYAAATVKLDVSSLTLGLGETKQLKASIQKGYSGEVRWFTSNEGVVAVDDGVAHAVVDVILEYQVVCLLEQGSGRHQLIGDVEAVSVLVDHPDDPLELPLGDRQILLQQFVILTH